jgi:hypothetical protein
MFFRGSRYENVPETGLTDAGGRTIRYKRMRFIPEGRGALATIVRDGDRTDLVAYNTLGDPEQFWRLCDVNRIQRPAELARNPGTRIQVPGPEGG